MRDCRLHAGLGEACVKLGHLEAAAQAYRPAVTLAPSDVHPMTQLALILEERRENPTSIYQQILKLDPDHPIALNNLASRMADSGDRLDLALSYAQRALQKLPDNPVVLDTLGWISIPKNLYDDAVGIFRGLRKKDPANAGYSCRLALALARKGELVEARETLRAFRGKPSRQDEAKIGQLLPEIG